MHSNYHYFEETRFHEATKEKNRHERNDAHVLVTVLNVDTALQETIEPLISPISFNSPLGPESMLRV